MLGDREQCDENAHTLAVNCGPLSLKIFSGTPNLENKICSGWSVADVIAYCLNPVRMDIMQFSFISMLAQDYIAMKWGQWRQLMLHCTFWAALYNSITIKIKPWSPHVSMSKLIHFYNFQMCVVQLFQQLASQWIWNDNSSAIFGQLITVPSLINTSLTTFCGKPLKTYRLTSERIGPLSFLWQFLLLLVATCQ